MAVAKDVFAIASAHERCSCESCRSAPRDFRSIVLVPQAVIDVWTEEVCALPARRRASWKSRLLDRRGVQSRVRFRVQGNLQGPWPTHFEEYNTLVSKWLPIFPYETARDAFASFRLNGPLSESVDAAMQKGDFEALNSTFAPRSSGKHRRNKWISIPTPAGEPTRG